MSRFTKTMVVVLLLAAFPACGAAPLPVFDFTKPAEVARWVPSHDISALKPTPAGMVIHISGGDPYTHGPARQYPVGAALWLCMRLNSQESGSVQVFTYTGQVGTSEAASVRAAVRGGKWVDVRMPIYPLGPTRRLRIDPPGTKGTCTIARIWFEPRVLLKEPVWPRPVAPTIGPGSPRVSSGDVQLRHAAGTLDAFTVSVGGRTMACGNTSGMIGYSTAKGLGWIQLARSKVTTRPVGGGFSVMATARDSGGATWRISRQFSSGRVAGVLDVRTTVTVDRDRTVVYLPMLALLPGVGSFGARRDQAVMPGMEYLDAPDTSSSEADIRGPGSHRRTPDTLRLCFPLLAIQQQDQAIGITWSHPERFTALFDTPDRTFRSGGHLLGVLFPGSDGLNRVEGDLLPYKGETLKAGRPLTLDAAILGAPGGSIVPMLQRYVALRGLPPVPAVPSVAAYSRRAAAGWLDSKLRQGARFRHAYWPGFDGFAPNPAADAATYMDWLAQNVEDAALADRLRQSARAALAEVPRGQANGSGVSHVGYPVESLLYGDVSENVRQAVAGAEEQLQRFEPDGTLIYHKAPNGLDYGSTHYEKHANGYAAPYVARILEAASISADSSLLREGLRLLDALDRYDNTVPRGAQTWEMPLHTPDILGSAYLLRAYTLGYEMTGKPEYLRRARYWAWTGLPFIYLWNPTGQPMGLYASSGVFGATQWIAPNWMGQPVQWCVLVYADALYRFARHDPRGPWLQIARGVTASGIEQVFPPDDPDLQGLLPDSINLRPQTRNGSAINPGTVQSNAAHFYAHGLYDFRATRLTQLFLHAPGPITVERDTPEFCAFSVDGWPRWPYRVLVAGVHTKPVVAINGERARLDAPHEWNPATGLLILQVSGKARITLGFGGE